MSETTIKLTYKDTYRCDNCGRQPEAEIPFGTLRPDSVVCSYCGCMTDGTAPIPPEPEREWILEYHRNEIKWVPSSYNTMLNGITDYSLRRSFMFGLSRPPETAWSPMKYRWRNTITGEVGQIRAERYVEDIWLDDPVTNLVKKFKVIYTRHQHGTRIVDAVDEKEAREVAEKGPWPGPLDNDWDTYSGPDLVDVREVE